MNPLPNVALCLLLAAPSLAADLPLALPPTETLVYKRAADRELKLFIEKPAAWQASDQRPALLFFFGGGWVGGSPAQFLPQSRYLASRGIIGIRVEYRTLSPSEPGPPTICCADAKSALRWVRGHAATLGLDPQRLAAGGGSAGGHLAAFTALVPGLDDPQDDLALSCRPNALVLFNPVFDNGPGQWGHDRLGSRYQAFSPAHHISPQAPPTLVFLGDQDPLIPLTTLQRFQSNMQAAGARCQTHIFSGAAHGFFNREPYLTLTLIQTDRFLASLGWLTGDPTLQPPPP